MLKKKIVVSQYHIFFPFFLILFLVAGLFITVYQTNQKQNINSHAAGVTNCTVGSSHLTTKSQEKALFDIINNYRLDNKLDVLSWDNTLKQSAAWMSLDMVAHSSLSHIDSLGRTPDIRLANCGYETVEGYGENIAGGPPDATTIFTVWKNDPAHNQVLLDTRYNIVGIAMEVDATGQHAYWTMDLGKGTFSTPLATPTPLEPINNPSTTTAVGTVTPTDIIPTDSGSPSDSTTPTDAQNQQPTPTSGPVTADMLIAVKVQISGIGQGGNAHPKHLTRRITAYIYGTGIEPVTTGTGFLTYDGSNYFTGTIHLGKLAQGSYFIKLASDNTLQVLAKPEFQTLVINTVNTIPPVILYQGDMNTDNVLNIDDYNLELPCFQNKNCDTAGTIDFNDDGKTDVTDYNLMLHSFEVLHGN